MTRIPHRVNKYNELQKLFTDVAYGDRNTLIRWAVNVKGVSLEEVAEILDMTKQNVHQIVKEGKYDSTTV